MPPIVLAVGATDPSSGAGVTADLRMLNSLGIWGTAAVTAVTVQDTRGVEEVHPLDAAWVARQIDVVVADLPPAAVKIGALGNGDVASAVASALERNNLHDIVLDPVVLSSSGHPLLDAMGVEVLKSRLLPLCRVLTANWAELALFSGLPVDCDDSAMDAASAIVALGCDSVLAKGGHSNDPNRAVDFLVDSSGEVQRFEAPRVPGPSPHGTGCALSSLIAGYLASGDGLTEAVQKGKSALSERIAEAATLGRGAPLLL